VSQRAPREAVLAGNASEPWPAIRPAASVESPTSRGHTHGSYRSILTAVLNILRGLIVATVASSAGASSNALGTSAGFAPQNRDQDIERSTSDGSREVVQTAPTQADRFEKDHVIVYIDKGLLTAEAELEFSGKIEGVFVATSAYLHRGFDRASRKTAKPAYYLTNRAGISHSEPTRIFLFARRVIPSPAIVIHETVHLLLAKKPDAPRNRADVTPEEDARLMANSGMWLAEGFAGYVSYELAPTLNMEPDHLFVMGDKTTVDAETRQWLRDPRGTKVLPFIGSRGVPEDILADRQNVAAPFYVLGQSFIKYLVQHGGLAPITRLYEEHFDRTRSIEDDVKRITGKDLARWRAEWLAAIGGSS
jgi:hypothetical protein